MNAMLYVRGRPLDYDLWVEQGAPGWGWDDVLPYFLRSEDNARGASEFHGAGGELRVSEQRSPRPLDRRLIEASAADRDPADRRLQRARAGRRVDVPGASRRTGAAGARPTRFLRPALKRPNLEVITGATVLGARARRRAAPSACAIRASAAGRDGRRAAGEVILSAGAIGSPQILMLSGIGAADELRDAGVEARHELPGVGRNLQDHPYLTMLWEVSEGPTLYGADKPKYLLEWLAAPLGTADLDRRRGGRVRPHTGRAAGGRHPVPHGRRCTSRSTARRSSTATR